MKTKDLKKVEEALELHSLDELLKAVAAVDLDQLKIEKMGPVEAYFTIREKEYLERRVKAKVKPDKRKPEFRKKLHWKTRERKRKEYYKQVSYPRYLRKMSQLVSDKGWYDIIKGGWERWGWTVHITREEWATHIEPLLVGRVPYTERYNTSNPVITLAGIMIFDKTDTGRLRKPLFDGAEFHLKQLGYTL